MEIDGDDILSVWKKSLEEVTKSDKRILAQRREQNTTELRNFQMIIKSPETDFDLIPQKDKERGYNYETVSDEIYWDTIINRRLEQFPSKEKGLIDQLQVVREKLRVPHNRQAYATIWSPEEDTINEHPICILGIYFYIRENALHMEAVLRSNDAWGQGLNDIYHLVKIQKRIAKELKIEVGSYIHNAMSYHIYEADLPMVKKYLGCEE